MTPSAIRAEVVLERVAWIRAMLDELRALPASSPEEFMADRRNPASAESYLRRALEALLDTGRHLLARGFGEGVVEYKQIAERLQAHDVLSPAHAAILTRMAGYRNRLTHFYHEVNASELFDIVASHLQDIEGVLDALLEWLRSHPDRLDRSI